MTFSRVSTLSLGLGPRDLFLLNIMIMGMLSFQKINPKLQKLNRGRKTCIVQKHKKWGKIIWILGNFIKIYQNLWNLYIFVCKGANVKCWVFWSHGKMVGSVGGKGGGGRSEGGGGGKRGRRGSVVFGVGRDGLGVVWGGGIGGFRGIYGGFWGTLIDYLSMLF